MPRTAEFQQNLQDPIAHRPDMLSQDALRIKPYAKWTIEDLADSHQNGGKVRVRIILAPAQQQVRISTRKLCCGPRTQAVETTVFFNLNDILSNLGTPAVTSLGILDLWSYSWG